MKFYSIKERIPDEGQSVVYVFQGKAFVGKYEAADPEIGQHCFYSQYGFLTDDVEWWYPICVI